LNSVANKYPREKLKSVADTLLNQFDRVLENQKKLLIVLHNNPDPDALASGLALSYLVKERYNIRSTIAYGGMIGRAENQALVREIKIPLKKIRRIRFAAYDKIVVGSVGSSAKHFDLAIELLPQIETGAFMEKVLPLSDFKEAWKLTKAGKYLKIILKLNYNLSR